MTNPTSNYSWQMPTSTDLVTDLPADFEVFGQAVDTTTKALNPSTTLGDIEYRSATANTNTRLGIGTNGQFLSVSGGVPAWATIAAGGGQTLISTTSLSGTSVTLSSIPQTYKKLVIYISGATNTAVDSFIFSLQINGVTTSKYNYVSMNSANGTLNASAANYTAIRMQGANVNYSSMMNNLTIEIDNYTYAQQKAVRFYGTGSISGTPADEAQFYSGVGGYAINAAAANAAVTSLTIFDSYASRTFDGGTIYLYGVN
jgi:hypothetical protein